MSEPIPDRPERFTTNYDWRVPSDREDADIVTILGDALDTLDADVPVKAAEAAEPYATAANTARVAAEAAQAASELAGIKAMTTTQRDALAAAARPIGRVIYNTTVGQYEGRKAGGWEPVAPQTRVDVFTTTGIYSLPALARAVEVIAIGGGNGGGNQQGGAGGALGRVVIPAAALPAMVPVTVGVGGVGVTGTPNGTALGTASSFGTFLTAGSNSGSGSSSYLIGGRLAGTVANTGTGNEMLEGQGGHGRGQQNPGGDAPAGGGGGGGMSNPGGASGSLAGGAGGSSAAAPTGNAQPGTSRSGSGLAGSGGGGGYVSALANDPRGSGAAGGIPGGGGGASAAALAGLIGGSGGRGEVVVITYF